MRKIEDLLFFYELYLEGLDERNLLQWSMVLMDFMPKCSSSNCLK